MSQEKVKRILSVSRRKQYAECKLELIDFDQDFIAASADDIGGVHDSWFNEGINAAANIESGYSDIDG